MFGGFPHIGSPVVMDLVIYIKFGHVGSHDAVLNYLKTIPEQVWDVCDMTSGKMKITARWKYNSRILDRLYAMPCVDYTNPAKP